MKTLEKIKKLKKIQAQIQSPEFVKMYKQLNEILVDLIEILGDGYDFDDIIESTIEAKDDPVADSEIYPYAVPALIHYMEEDLKEEKKQKKEKQQSIPNGSLVRFSSHHLTDEELTEMGVENASFYERMVAEVKHLETATCLGEKDHEYYTIEFEYDGQVFKAVSGYNLEVLFSAKHSDES